MWSRSGLAATDTAPVTRHCLNGVPRMHHCQLPPAKQARLAHKPRDRLLNQSQLCSVAIEVRFLFRGQG